MAHFALDPQLLRSVQAPAGSLHATLAAHGQYIPFHFVLRLSPEVHRKLAALPSGVASSAQIGFDGAQAFSTYLHETIHWWQHIGSTYGLMASLSYPTQAHGNFRQLRELLGKVGFKKSISRLTDQLPGPSRPDTLQGLTNIIVNNHFDFGAFRRLTFNQTTAVSLASDLLFESTAHALQIAYANNVLLMAATADPEFKPLDHPKHWEKPFDELTKEKLKGFYYGSPLEVWPIGVQEILEGQACFGQLQYLHFASGGALDWDDFRGLGMLHGVYKKAFEEFLKCTRLDWPASINHPTVALFLLICDMAINPGSGFPFSPSPHFPSFISDTVPGIRFLTLATMVRLKCPHIAGAIRNYSRDEYVDVSEELAAVTLIQSPLKIATTCRDWANGPMAGLMEEHRTFDFGPVNTVVRVLLSHFLAFMQDKFSVPEFFAWPGVLMAGDRLSSEAYRLFDRHGALFVDKENDDGVFPRLRPDRSEELVQKTFDTFFSAHVVYDMANQWIVQPGPFTYDFSWLKPSATDGEFKSFADRSFSHAFGVQPDSVQLI